MWIQVWSLPAVLPWQFAGILWNSDPCRSSAGMPEPTPIGPCCPTLCDPVDCSPPGSSVHGESPGKNTGVGCHALLLTQRSNLRHSCRECLLHWQEGSLPLTPNRAVLTHSAVSNPLWSVDCSPPGSSVPGILQARILQWVAVSSSKTGLWVQLNEIRCLRKMYTGVHSVFFILSDLPISTSVCLIRHLKPIPFWCPVLVADLGLV